MCAILPTRAISLFTSWHNRLSGKIHHDLSFPVIHLQSSPQPPCSPHLPPHATSKSHSKHIVPSGGFAQPTLSLVLRREDLRNPSQHLGLSTSDRVLVGYHYCQKSLSRSGRRSDPRKRADSCRLEKTASACTCLSRMLLRNPSID